MNDLVSVIIPTFSRPNNLVRAIESVLAQTYSPIEIIVVDDNGIDTPYQRETESLLGHYIDKGIIKYIKHEININGSAARNTGFKVSKGRYINYLDDDDEFTKDKISLQVEKLKGTAENVGACFCNTKVKYKHHDDFLINSKEGNLAEDILCGDAHFNTSTVLFKRDAIDTINGFDETFRRHQDWELYVRFFRHYDMCNACREPLLVKNVTETSVITANPLRQIEYREKFLNTFKSDINQMSKANDIYCFQYLSLGNLLMFYKERRTAFKYLSKAYKYKTPTLKSIKENIACFLKSFIF